MTRAGTSMNYVYDAVGNRTQRTDYNGVVTNYTYDNLDRLTTITYPTRTVTYAYDPLNNMTRATNENGSVYISYDNRYRVSSFSDPFYYGISYNYDAVGNRTKLKVNGATYATYTYDAVNRLTSLKDGANLNFAYSYDSANRLTSRSAASRQDLLSTLLDVHVDIKIVGNMPENQFETSETPSVADGSKRAIVKGLGCLGFIIATLILWLLSHNWFVFLLLLLPYYLFGEWVSEKIFVRRSSWSTEKSGFSILRIVGGVTVVLVLGALTYLAISLIRWLFS